MKSRARERDEGRGRVHLPQAPNGYVIQCGEPRTGAYVEKPYATAVLRQVRPSFDRDDDLDDTLSCPTALSSPSVSALECLLWTPPATPTSSAFGHFSQKCPSWSARTAPLPSTYMPLPTGQRSVGYAGRRMRVEAQSSLRRKPYTHKQALSYAGMSPHICLAFTASSLRACIPPGC